MRRFIEKKETVLDDRTGLMWARDAALSDFPMTWAEGLAFVADLNRFGFGGFSDWKLPNRKELFSLVSHDHINPALPDGHPFTNVFNGYYWTSTTCARLPDQAWYVHLGGARVFKGMKYGSYMIWPVRATDKAAAPLLSTGQQTCYDENGATVDCQQSGQDGEHDANRTANAQRIKPSRFKSDGSLVYDAETKLTWLKNAGFGVEPVDWAMAQATVAEMNRRKQYGYSDWRLPGIRELESLTHMDAHSPALPKDAPFDNARAFYWSATTSQYDTDYAWVLYLIDGAVGVGYKNLPEFYLWPVRGTPSANLAY